MNGKTLRSQHRASPPPSILPPLPKPVDIFVLARSITGHGIVTVAIPGYLFLNVPSMDRASTRPISWLGTYGLEDAHGDDAHFQHQNRGTRNDVSRTARLTARWMARNDASHRHSSDQILMSLSYASTIKDRISTLKIISCSHRQRSRYHD